MLNNIMKKYLIIILAVFLLGCSKSNRVVIQVGSDKITLKELKTRLKEIPDTYKNYLNTYSGQKQFIDLIVRERILIEMAKKQKLNNKDEIKKAIKNFKDDYKRRIKEFQENLIATELMKELYNKKFTPTETELRNYYEKNKSDFLNPVKIRLSHILVQTQQEADEVYKRLKSGENFKKLAKTVSIDPSSNINGGELGVFKKSEIFIEFLPFLEKLKIGNFSPPIKTSFGYHIIKKDDEILLPSQNYEEAKSDIRQSIIKEKFEQWLEQKKIELGVKVDYNLLKGEF